MEIKIVLGSLWGDEGKGNTVQWLCKQAINNNKKPCVVRFSGGPQAGHTVVHNNITHVCSSFGSGVLLGVPTFYIGNNVFIDPLCIENERKVLEKKGILIPELYVSKEVELITPYDVVDQQEWAKNNPNMTCGKGIMSAKLRGRVSVSWFGAEANKSPFISYLDSVKAIYQFHKKDYTISQEIIKNWIESTKKLSYLYSFGSLENFDVVIFEGTQGLLLDEEYGLYPYTTSTKVGLNGIPTKYLKDADVYFVTRTYFTRHGKMDKLESNHFNDNKLCISSSKLETNIFNKFQGEFKTAEFDSNYIFKTIQRHHLDNYQKKYNLKYNFVVTHMDVPVIGHTAIPDRIIYESRVNDLKINKIYISEDPYSNLKEY